jgi:ligand-binding sensor domain-containing protein
MKRIAGIILWTFLFFDCVGQVPFFQSYFLLKKNEPLHVNTIFQDKTGFVWFGTNKGLFKFDGLKYRHFGLADSLADENVTAIAEDSLHRIWIGHRNGKIGYIEKGAIRKFDPREGLPTKAISDILFDKKGNLWFSTLDDGLYYFTEDRLFRVDETDGMPDLFVYDILEDEHGDVWAGTDGGVAICSLHGKKVSVSVLNYGHGLPDNIIKKLVLGEKGTVWMATEDAGIIIYDPVTNQSSPMIKGGWHYGTISDFLFYGNQVWISSLTEGLVVFSRRTQQARIYNSKTVPGLASTNTLLKDYEGNVWVGSKTGVLRALGDYVRYIETFDPVTNANVVALAIDKKGNIWFSNSSGLFRRSSQESGNIATERQLINTPFQNKTVISLFVDSAGYLWAGLYGEGALRINPVTGRIRYLNKELRNGNVLNITGKGNEVWLATLGGATHVEIFGEELTCKNYGSGEGLISDYIYQVFIDSRNRVWFATDGKGVDMKDASGIHHYDSGLNSKIVYGFAEDGNHKIWVNVPGEGLYQFDGTRFKILGATTPLRDNNVNCLASDRFGNIVAMHELGIDVYDIKKNKIRYLGEEVGIRNKLPNLNATVSDGQGRIFFGTDAGIVVYASRIDTTSTSTTPLPFISGLKIFDQSIDLSGNLSFSYDENDIVIGYLGFWYQNPESLSFQYRLGNYDRDWVTSRDRSATYSSLPPGQYEFRLRVSDTDDFTDAKESSIKFVIRPPFWKTTWFFLLTGFAVVAAGYVLIRYRERKLLEDNRLLEAKVKERTLEIQKKTDEIQAQNEEIQSQAEEIRGINEHLELLVKQRTEELIKKNKALEEYAFINAHSLRAPVASVLGLINLACKIEMDEESKNIIKHLQISAEKLDAIVSSITQAIEKGE